MVAEYEQAQARERLAREREQEREQDREQRERYDRGGGFRREVKVGPLDVTGWRPPEKRRDSGRHYYRILALPPNPLLIGPALLRAYAAGYRKFATANSDKMPRYRSEGDGDELENVTHCRLLLGSRANGRTGIRYSNAGFPTEFFN